MIRAVLMAILFVMGSMAGCISNETAEKDEDEHSENDSDSEHGANSGTTQQTPCDNHTQNDTQEELEWLFSQSANGIAFDMSNDAVSGNANLPVNASAMGVNATITVDEWVGHMVSYSEAVKGEKNGHMELMNNTTAVLKTLSFGRKNADFTGKDAQGNEYTVVFKMVSTNVTSDGKIVLGVIFTGFETTASDGALPEELDLTSGAFFIDSWNSLGWCEFWTSVVIIPLVYIVCTLGGEEICEAADAAIIGIHTFEGKYSDAMEGLMAMELGLTGYDIALVIVHLICGTIEWFVDHSKSHWSDSVGDSFESWLEDIDG